MTEKTKKMLVIAAGTIACAALVIGIAMRSGGNSSAPQNDKDKPTAPSESGSSSIVLDIDSTTPNPDIHVEIPDSTTDPGSGADSSGTDQAIQGDPTKPSEPEPPKPPIPSAQKDQEHDSDDVPAEDRNTPDHPEYTEPPQPTKPAKPESTEPAPGSTDDSGKVYVPGFGYVEDSGENHGGELDDMYENGNKIGTMG